MLCLRLACGVGLLVLSLLWFIVWDMLRGCVCKICFVPGLVGSILCSV